MHRPYDLDLNPLVRKLESIVDDLTAHERDGLRGIPMMVRDVYADQDIVRDGDRPSQCCLVLEGTAFRYKLAGEDRRQILAFHLPGEIPDLQSLHLETMDHSLAALTPAKLGFIQHRVMHKFMADFPRLAGVFWRETLIDAAIFREWMVGMGRRKAPSRIAHLFCEMYVRLDGIGFAKEGTVPLRITQDEIGDALGLSAVHTNRALQYLRSEGYITHDGRKLTIHDWAGLSKAGEFDPTYLHQTRGEGASAKH